jgi:hypothetical protein
MPSHALSPWYENEKMPFGHQTKIWLWLHKLAKFLFFFIGWLLHRCWGCNWGTRTVTRNMVKTVKPYIRQTSGLLLKFLKSLRKSHRERKINLGELSFWRLTRTHNFAWVIKQQVSWIEDIFFDKERMVNQKKLWSRHCSIATWLCFISQFNRPKNQSFTRQLVTPKDLTTLKNATGFSLYLWLQWR